MALREKLQQMKGMVKETEINWEAEKNKWLSSVRQLFKEVNYWLADLANEGYIRITENEITVLEENIGKYTVPKLEIHYGGICAILEPVGTNVVGCDGRTDFFLRGESFRGYMLILVRTDNSDEWQMVGKVIQGEPVQFNKEVFEGTLEKWLG